MTPDFDAAIIGAGCVGLAVGRALAARGLSAVVLERHARFGEETSSRNSEVIHAGLYYPTGSLKARLCVEGKRALYAYGAERGFRADPIGKLIVATAPEELAALDQLMARGEANGVEGLSLIDAVQAQALEPQIACEAAILSASSGLVDSHLYMLALLGDIEAAGGAFARSTPFERAHWTGSAWQVTAGGEVFTAVKLINAAGLLADHAAQGIEGLSAREIPEVRFAKGDYFRVTGPMPFSRLIYPAPNPSGHGVHYTPMADGRARLGPDVEMIASPRYEVDEGKIAAFTEGAARYWPEVRRRTLLPDYVGVRPKIGAAPKGFEDFRIDGPERHGLPGLFCLYGIDSPGLTSSFALGELVAEACEKP